MNSEFLTALNEIEKEKNISKDLILDAIDAALVSAYKRNYNTNQNNVLVNIDRESGEVKVFVCKEVVEILNRYNVKTCAYGHIHGPAIPLAVTGTVEGIDYKMVSADAVDFKPVRILD